MSSLVFGINLLLNYTTTILLYYTTSDIKAVEISKWAWGRSGWWEEGRNRVPLVWGMIFPATYHIYCLLKIYSKLETIFTSHSIQINTTRQWAFCCYNLITQRSKHWLLRSLSQAVLDPVCLERLVFCSLQPYPWAHTCWSVADRDFCQLYSAAIKKRHAVRFGLLPFNPFNQWKLLVKSWRR